MDVRDVNGQTIEPEGNWLVVVFLSEECPLSNEAVPFLNNLHKEFEAKGFTILGAYCDPTLDVQSLQKHRDAYQQQFGSADDRMHRLVNHVKATYTPEAFVFDAGGNILYQGRIDNRVEDFGISRPNATRTELHDVMQALNEGKSGPFENVKGFGCAIPQKVK